MSAGRQPDDFGASVALSADGTTAVVGAPRDNNYKGAAWIFTKRGTSWASTKITGVRKEPAQFGQSVAVSANGRVVVVGAPNDDDHKGSAWVYRSAGGGVWVGAKLVPRGSDGDSTFGYDVSISADGSKIVVGGPGDDKRAVVGVTGRGAVWTYTRSGNRWTQQGSRIKPPSSSGRGNYGWSVALSGDGSTLLVGAPATSDDDGVAFLYGASGARWQRIGGRILFWQADKPTNEPKSRFGFDVALSRDGTFGVLGAPFEPANNRAGAAYVIERTGSGWREAARLLGGGEQGRGQFGRVVTISGDGSTAIVTGLTDNKNQGAAWTFLRSGSAWSQDGPKWRRGNALFGFSAALSAGGGRALIAGSGERRATAYLFLNEPTIVGLNPLSGPLAGGTRVTITGSGFTDVRSVMFGTSRATSFTVESPQRIAAVSPSGSPGPVDVTVRASVGTSAVTPVGRFTYVGAPVVSRLEPSLGPASGGTSVVITGTNLAGASRVSFGGNDASFKVDTESQITAVAPAGQPGTVAVTVTTPGGTSTVTPSSQYTYTTLRTITFDNLTTGGPGGVNVPVTTQYASQGLTFTNASAVDYGKGGPAFAGFARSGTVGVEPCVGVEFCTSAFRASFSAPQFAASVWVGFSFQLNAPLQVQLRAYDGSGSQIGTATVTLPARTSPTPITQRLEVRQATRVIRSVEVLVPGGFNNAVAIDDVSFEG